MAHCDNEKRAKGRQLCALIVDVSLRACRPVAVGLAASSACLGSVGCRRVQEATALRDGKSILHVATRVIFLKFPPDFVIP